MYIEYDFNKNILHIIVFQKDYVFKYVSSIFLQRF